MGHGVVGVGWKDAIGIEAMLCTAIGGSSRRHRALLALLWSLDAWRSSAAEAAAGLQASGSRAPEAAEAALPPAVVVHGRRGPNSGINGVYIRDYVWRGNIGPCYRRGGATGQKAIFLYFEGEWRMGPSPEEGSVWAYARSGETSPLHIGAPWEVWDGQRVVEDPQMQVSDTSVIPSVLFLSFGGQGVPPGLRALQGMMMQQPGLWDGRPYFRHSAWEELFLLCSVPEGRWRLGPLPLRAAPGTDGSIISGALLYAASAASLPQEIVESWHIPINETNRLTLGEGSVRLATTSALGAPTLPHHHHPRHLVVEGVGAGDGFANGVYRRAPELLNQRPVYHKTDALRTASLWFAGGDWRLGPAIESGRDWAYAPSTVFSPLEIDAPWQRLDGQAEAVHLADAAGAIPGTVVVAGERYAQQHRLCDARPVYQREQRQHGAPDVFLFFRVHEGEWWLGPVVGGTECYARAAGSRLRVVPEASELLWRQVVQEHTAAGERQGRDDFGTILDVDEEDFSGRTVGTLRWCCGLLLAAVLAACGMCRPPVGAWQVAATRVAEALDNWQLHNDGSLEKSPESKTRKRSSLSCVVCLEASRDILLLPCRHVCCCKACADRLERCPMCRAWKTAFTKVFL